MSETAFLGLGSNLGDRLAATVLVSARAALGGLKKPLTVEPIAMSPATSAPTTATSAREPTSSVMTPDSDCEINSVSTVLMQLIVPP